jgi:transcriptional regulator with PAS, ATPase and Fis domain
LGGIIAATNQNLRELMSKGKFREELFHRLAVDVIRTPAMRDQLAEAPGDLWPMVLHIAMKLRGPVRGPPLAETAMKILRIKRGPRYLWPGNFRELERTVLRIRVHDKDALALSSTQRPAPASDTAARLGRDILSGRMTLEEVDRRVVQAVFEKTKSRRRGAKMLDIDRERFAKLLREALGKETPET